MFQLHITKSHDHVLIPIHEFYSLLKKFERVETFEIIEEQHTTEAQQDMSENTPVLHALKGILKGVDLSLHEIRGERIREKHDCLS